LTVDKHRLTDEMAKPCWRAEKRVEAGQAEQISARTIRQALKKKQLKP
jgi:hypothetical protein